tara:strand:- start:149 stop:289 length:141 start_codon:yes stop_codon:yes gene_type:complete
MDTVVHQSELHVLVPVEELGQTLSQSPQLGQRLVAQSRGLPFGLGH